MARPVETKVSPFYISSSVAASTPRSHVLKQGDGFVVLDQYGDAQALGPAPEGLFFEDTRYLSRFLLTIDQLRPILLASTVSEDNALLSIDLTNPDLFENSYLRIARDTIHILRTMVLGEAELFVRLELHNYGAMTVRFRLGLDFDADYADLFEVRGAIRRRRGEILPDEQRTNETILAYRGVDGVVRRTCITFDTIPIDVSPRHVEWEIPLAPNLTKQILLGVRCVREGKPSRATSYAASLAAATERVADRKVRAADLYTSNETFNDLLNQSRADLDMLVSSTPHGLYAYAGIPWFSTAFGRDGIITALECLWLDPPLAEGTLRYLAATQSTTLDSATDAEPGKILHETRKGEMAALGEVPFARYYGSIDATPLFVMLAAAYHARTGDLDLIRALWPNIEAALAWIREYGDLDGDGFIEYDRQSVNGLINQGWKDSRDSIFHADGNLAEAPIALAEVQAYVFGAYQGAAVLASALGYFERANEASAAAKQLRQRFEATFWLDELSTYALALDGRKRPCRVRASNAGHVLLCGLAAPERAQRVAEALMKSEFFSGWGIRSIASDGARYNPISYHNGSVWPHDNGLIALGFARYGLTQPLVQLLSGLFDASLFMEMRRLPELFCGFTRRPGTGPTRYPVACVPQAWSSASVFAMLGAVLGISFSPPTRQIRFTRPTLPAWLDEIRITNLRLGNSSVDLLLQRSHDTVALRVMRREGEMDITLTV